LQNHALKCTLSTLTFISAPSRILNLTKNPS